MKKLIVTSLVFALALLSGCSLHKQVAPVPGQLNAADASIYRSLYDIQGGIDAVKSSIADGTITLDANQTKLFNDLKTAYNLAETAYQAYRAIPTPANLSTLQVSVSSAQTKLSNFTNASPAITSK